MKTVPQRQMRELLGELEILLATIRASLGNSSARGTMLRNYDEVSALIMRRFAECGFSPEDLMELERNLAKLRVTLDEVAG